MIINRRDFIRMTGLGLAGMLIDDAVGQYALAQAAPSPQAPLITEVEGVCRRLAQHGWRDLLLGVTGGKFDLGATNLAGELAKPLAPINRHVPGFEDFAAEGQKAIEPGNPARSLLFHALASPAVVQGVPGKPLTDFPNPAELEAVENYVYGVTPPTLAELRAKGAELAIVVFAPEYRTVSHTVHRKHAEMTFSRTGFARVGTIEASYDGPSRNYLLLDENRPFAFRVIPARFAPYIAMKAKGQANIFGPMRFQPDDKTRDFWVPLHKLFSGRECIAGLDLEVKLGAHFVNKKLQRFHKYMAEKGLVTGWEKSVPNERPFVIEDKVIADFSVRREDGQGLIMPEPHPLFEKATYKGKLLGFDVPTNYSEADASLWFSTLQILPGDGETCVGDPNPNLDLRQAYMDGLNPCIGRPVPEYVNTRHQLVDEDRVVVDLNKATNKKNEPIMFDKLKAGGYRALHFIDYTADGWVGATCPQLENEIRQHVPAYSPVAPPDFFPAVTQRALLEWWERDAPEDLRPGLWSIDPLALCDIRMAANIEAPPEKYSINKFSIQDDTVTAIVSHPGNHSEWQPRPRPADEPSPFTRLPDGSNGVFDPGWDVSQDKDKVSGKLFLQNYGLGTPFIEDVKLCAALGSFWAAVVPDATRTFQPGKKPERNKPWPWPTVIPLTDEEIGIVEVKGGGFYPWDGVRGPQIEQHDGKQWARYPDINYVDYTTLDGRMTAVLTSRIDLKEYQSRVRAMAAVYRALGVHYEQVLRDCKDDERRVDRAVNRLQRVKSDWAVVSFRKLDAPTEESRAAEQQAGTKLRTGETYRFHVFLHGKEKTDYRGHQHILVEMKEQAVFFADGTSVLKKGNEKVKWQPKSPCKDR